MLNKTSQKTKYLGSSLCNQMLLCLKVELIPESHQQGIVKLTPVRLFYYISGTSIDQIDMYH